MPLVDLVTDLKSLKYGKDTPGGGYSGQPYIQAKIPDGLEPKSPDFILRGGYLTVGDSLTDIKRLGKMFGDLKSPNGVLFIAKQNVLSNSAVRTQAGGTLNNGVYTPLSTLAQAGLVAFGGHLNKQGTDPTGLSPLSLRTYSDVVNPTLGAAFSLKSTNNNRLVRLASEKIKGNYIGNVGISLVDNSISSLSNNILTYRGGPGSILGVGFTNIGFADQRTGENNPQYIPYEDYIVKSVLNNKQEGGLKIDTGNGTKTWIKAGAYFDGNAKNVYFVDNDNFLNGLPSNNVNTPQSASLSNIPDGSKTWTPKQNNPDSLKYYKTLTLIGDQSKNNGVSGKYSKLTNKPINNYFNFLGAQIDTYNHNVYEPATEGNTWPENSPLIYVNNTFTYTQDDLIQTEPTLGKLSGSPKLQDFRKILREKLGEITDVAKNATKSGATPFTPDYTTKNLETRVNIGGNDGFGPGSKALKNLSSYTSGSGIGAQDLINALSIYRSENVDTELPVNDLVKFRIAAIDNDNPAFKTFMHFRAFIDSFNDSYSADWGSTRYLGRGENFYTYNGFNRTISLSFTVAAQSKEELIPMYKKLNYLASQLAPDYSPNGYMRGSLVQLTLGGYLYEQVGFITALTYDIPNDTTWEIGINDEGGYDSTVKELPHRITVSGFQFTPIHNFVPSKQGLGFDKLENEDKYGGLATSYGPERFIALSAGGDHNYGDLYKKTGK